MKNFIKIFTSIVLTTFFASHAVLAERDIRFEDAKPIFQTTEEHESEVGNKKVSTIKDGIEGIIENNTQESKILSAMNITNMMDKEDGEFFIRQCMELFYDNVEWTVSEANTGFPRLNGKTPNRIMIDIYCPDIDSVYCFLIVYNPQLLDHEFESDHKVGESSEQTKPKSIHNNLLASDYGNPDRRKLFSQPFRNGLGMY